MIPEWLRWCAAVWLVFWMTVYWWYWGPGNFLRLCDVAVIVSCIGLWTSNSLLISSQAVGTLLVNLLWALDAGGRFFFGRHPIGGTEYLFDLRYPLWIRLLTLFHLVSPPLLLWALHRVGYSRRGWLLQSAITVAAFAATRWTSPELNINFAFRDPFFRRAWGAAPVHIAVSALFLVVVAYLPTHLFLRHVFPPPASSEAIRAGD